MELYRVISMFCTCCKAKLIADEAVDELLQKELRRDVVLPTSMAYWYKQWPDFLGGCSKCGH